MIECESHYDVIHSYMCLYPSAHYTILTPDSDSQKLYLTAWWWLAAGSYGNYVCNLCSVNSCAMHCSGSISKASRRFFMFVFHSNEFSRQVQCWASAYEIPQGTLPYLLSCAADLWIQFLQHVLKLLIVSTMISLLQV